MNRISSLRQNKVCSQACSRVRGAAWNLCERAKFHSAMPRTPLALIVYLRAQNIERAVVFAQLPTSYNELHAAFSRYVRRFNYHQIIIMTKLERDASDRLLIKKFHAFYWRCRKTSSVHVSIYVCANQINITHSTPRPQIALCGLRNTHMLFAISRNARRRVLIMIIIIII